MRRLPVTFLASWKQDGKPVSLPELHIRHIASNLRDVDKYEAVSVGQVPGAFAVEVVNASRFAAIMYYRDIPTFIFGALEVSPGVFSLWGYGTNHTSKVMRLMTELARHMGEALFRDFGARRLQVALPFVQLCEPNIAWLRDRLGMLVESVARHATVFGEPMLTLAYTIDEYEQYVHGPTDGEVPPAELCGSGTGSAESTSSTD